MYVCVSVCVFVCLCLCVCACAHAVSHKFEKRYKILSLNTQKKESTWKTRNKWDHNIKMGLQGNRVRGCGLNSFRSEWGRGPLLVNTIINLQFLQKARIFLTSYDTLMVSRMRLLHGIGHNLSRKLSWMLCDLWFLWEGIYGCCWRNEIYLFSCFLITLNEKDNICVADRCVLGCMLLVSLVWLTLVLSLSVRCCR